MYMRVETCLNWLHCSSLRLDLTSRNIRSHSAQLTLIKQPAVGRIKVSGKTCPHFNQCLLPNPAKQMFAHLLQVQPVDAILLAAIKSRNDAYELVVSVSPLLHLTHPKTQPLRRPLTIILPCPPNPEKKEETRRKENQEPQGWVPSHFLSHLDKVRWVLDVSKPNNFLYRNTK